MIMFLAGGLCLCAQERTITWTTDPVDGHRTGVGAKKTETNKKKNKRRSESVQTHVATNQLFGFTTAS